MNRPREVEIAVALIVIALFAVQINHNWPFTLSKLISFLFGVGISIPILFVVFRTYTGDSVARALFIPVAIGLSAIQYLQAFPPERIQYTAVTGTINLPPAPIPVMYMAIFGAVFFLVSVFLLHLPAANKWYREKRNAT